MPDKEGSDDEKKSTKSVVNKKQRQMMGEEEYDTYRDNILMRGGDHRSKETKERSYTPSKESKGKTAAQKAAKGKSALELVKASITKKYGKGAIMDVGKKKVNEELDLTQVAESFGGYIIEVKKGRKPKDYLTGRISLTGNVPPSKRMNPDDAKAQAKAQAETEKRLSDAEKSGKIDDFTSTPIKGAPDTKKLVRGKKGETIVNPVETSKQTAEKTARASTAGTGGKKVKDEGKFSKETDLEGAIKGKTKTPVTTPPKTPPKSNVSKPPKPIIVTGGVDRATDIKTKPEPKKLDPRKAPTKRVDLRKRKTKTARKARLPAGMTRQDKIEIEKRKITQKEPKVFLGKRITRKGLKGVIQKVRQTKKVTKKTAKDVGKGMVRQTKAFGRYAKPNPFAAAVVGTEVLDRVVRAIPKPRPPKLDAGVVGRRSAG